MILLKKVYFNPTLSCKFKSSVTLCISVAKGTDNAVRGVLLNDLALVKHVEFLCCILSSEEHDGFFPTWVVRQESRDIEDHLVDDDPTVFLCFVLGHLCTCVSPLHSGAWDDAIYVCCKVT